MNINYLNKKIKICIVGGTGSWGQRVLNAARIVNRYEVIGHINSSTTEEKKIELLNNADLIYVAVPDFAQKEYVEFILNNNKHGICESPFLMSMADRHEMYKLLNNKRYNKVFHVNYPYFLDQDFAKIASAAIRNKKNLKLFKIECSGDKFQNDFKLAKRMYAGQALNLICGICNFLNISKFDKFIVHDDYTGEVFANGINFLFSWRYSENPQLDISLKLNDSSEEETIVYDQYDQILPLLILMSERINHQVPQSIAGRQLPESFGSIEEITSKMVAYTYLMESTAEHFTDKFLEFDNEKIEEADSTNLFFNGGFPSK